MDAQPPPRQGRAGPGDDVSDYQTSLIESEIEHLNGLTSIALRRALADFVVNFENDPKVRAWVEAGFDVETGKNGIFPDLNDAWRPPFEGSDDLRASMEAYLTWEVNLIAQAERDGTARYSLAVGEGNGDEPYAG